MRRTWVVVLAAFGVLVAAAVFLRLPTLHEPISRDMGAYATIGQGIVAGEVPYRDLFDHKQPLIYPVYALLDAVAPRSTFAIRLTAAVLAAVAAAITFVALRKVVPLGHLVVAIALATVVAASPRLEGQDLNTEHLLVVFVAGMMAVAFRRRASVAAGVVGGLAVATKAVGIFIVPAALIPLLAQREEHGQTVAATLVRFTAGGAAALAVVVLPFAVSGNLGPFLDANLTYNRRYVATAPDRTPTSLLDLPNPLVLLVLVAFVVAAVRLWRDRDDYVTATLLIWLLGALVGAALGGRGFRHYYVPVVLPAACLAALPVLPRRPAWPERRGRPRATLVGSAVLCGVLAIPAIVDIKGQFGGGPATGVLAQLDDVGTFLRERRQPGGTVFVASAEPSFYWASGLRPATKYLFDYPRDLGYDFDAEVARTFRREPPQFVVLPRGCPAPEYLDGLLGGYRPVRQAGPVTVLERSPVGSGCA